jgi:hypothetical protein
MVEGDRSGSEGPQAVSSRIRRASRLEKSGIRRGILGIFMVEAEVESKKTTLNHEVRQNIRVFERGISLGKQKSLPRFWKGFYDLSFRIYGLKSLESRCSDL